jgi:hypothetical protein
LFGFVLENLFWFLFLLLTFRYIVGNAVLVETAGKRGGGTTEDLGGNGGGMLFVV